MNLNTEKFKVVGAGVSGRTFVGLITGAKSGTKGIVSVVQIEESEGVNAGDMRALEAFLNGVDESRIVACELDRFQKSELSTSGEVDNYVLVDITPEFAGKDCSIRWKTGAAFESVRSMMSTARRKVREGLDVKTAPVESVVEATTEKTEKKEKRKEKDA